MWLWKSKSWHSCCGALGRRYELKLSRLSNIVMKLIYERKKEIWWYESRVMTKFWNTTLSKHAVYFLRTLPCPVLSVHENAIYVLMKVHSSHGVSFSLARLVVLEILTLFYRAWQRFFSHRTKENDVIFVVSDNWAHAHCRIFPAVHVRRILV